MFINKLETAFRNNGQPEEMKIITIYRFVSLFFISLFFLTSRINIPPSMKTFIIACIGLSATLLNYLYQKNRNSSGNIMILVIIETIGNSLLLLPTGGLNSPFVWYSINTILIAAIMLGSLHCWINLSVYLFASTCLEYLIFNNGELGLADFFAGESNLILSLILISAIIQQLAMYIKRLRKESIKQAEINKRLSFANSKVRESINHIMELYQTVYMFTALNDKEDIIDAIIEYTKKVTKADKVFFYSFADSERGLIIKSSSLDKGQEDYIISKILESKEMIINSSIPFEVDIDGSSCLMAPVRSNCITYGVLGIKIARDQLKAYYIGYVDQLKFMSGLSSIVFEKFEMEQVNERLVITEEQNRIANEIHDSVLQRLFSTSFGIYGLMKNINNISNNELLEELNIVRNSIDNAMKELRTAIYSLSLSKGGTDNFVADTLKFIEETRKLNDVKIDFKLLGNSEVLSLLQKKSLYRIICEGIGNAVRHGKAKQIEVMLRIQSNVAVLKITDDGSGFDIKLIKQSRQGGLGIKNIETLAHYLKGKACINSTIGRGTSIKITFPICVQFYRGEKIV